MRIGNIVTEVLGVPTAHDCVAGLTPRDNCRYALDVGCGRYSHFTFCRPRPFTVGVDPFAPAIEMSKVNGLHDAYEQMAIPKDVRYRLTDLVPGGSFDMAGLFGVIEYLPRREGYTLQDRCEVLIGKCLVVETPNGFLERGPRSGNEFQRHR